MSENRIVVPERMLEAANEAWDHFGGIGVDNRIKVMLEAALRWLAENPVVPSTGWLDGMHESFCALRREGKIVGDERRLVIVEWQRRMFLAPVTEVPEEVKDLLLVEIEQGFWKPEVLNERIKEAFRRGQQSKK